MLPLGAFTALLLLISAVSAVNVPPPGNVTVSCQNFKTTVSWDYSSVPPQTIFRVNLEIEGSAGRVETETTEHQCDLSPYVWKSERYMRFLYVTVTAVQGGSQSEAVPSNTFSFNDLKTVDTKCKLNFPPVDINEGESRATVSLPNPLHFYKELKQSSKGNAHSFKFTVSPVTGEFDGFCTVNENTCKLDVLFPEGAEKCVTLKGLLFDGMGVNQVVFKEDQVCPPNSTEIHVVILVILLSVLVIIISVVVFLICKAKAWTMQLPKPPNFLTSQLPNHREPALRYDTVPGADISAVSVDKPHKTLLVTSEDNSHSENLQGSGSGSDCYPPARYLDMERLSDSNQEMEAVGLTSKENGTDDDSADDSVKTECVSVDLEEEERKSVSPYDCPHTHTVKTDMGDGDMATGYTGN